MYVAIASFALQILISMPYGRANTIVMSHRVQ